MLNLNEITSKQKLIIEKGLLDYTYIQKNYKECNEDFKDVYYNFYLKARWSIMTKPENSEPYFNLLKTCDPKKDLMEIIYILKRDMASHTYEFSLATKLLHTIEPQWPIYDSKIRKYLKSLGVNFVWNQSTKEDDYEEQSKIMDDYVDLCIWYDSFLNSVEGKNWIKWFNKQFPKYKKISDVKKIDFIIFATN